MAACHVGDTLNCMFPLGNGFTLPSCDGKKILLVGGGVGTAPLLYFGKILKDLGCEPVFLLGGRSATDLMQLDLFEQFGRVYVTTEDGSKGEKGFVTNHSILNSEQFDSVSTCGPKPMMMAVARWAAAANVPCEASLENLMACGLGHCIATDFPTYKKTSPNSRPGFFLELDNPYPEHLIGVAFFRFSGHLCQEVIAFLQISCSIFP